MKWLWIDFKNPVQNLGDYRFTLNPSFALGCKINKEINKENEKDVDSNLVWVWLCLRPGLVDLDWFYLFRPEIAGGGGVKQNINFDNDNVFLLH